MVDELEYDFVSVGSGAGGLSAALTVAERGGRALVIEKDWALGGVTALSGGQVWVGGSHLEGAAGIEDSVEEAAQYLEFLSDGFARPEMRATYVTQGPAVLRYLTETLGIPLHVIPEWPDYYFPTAPGSKGAGRFIEAEAFVGAELGEWAGRSILGEYTVTSEDRSLSQGAVSELARRAAEHRAKGERCAGAALAGQMIKAGLDLGVEFRVNTRAERLVLEAGRVVGVEVTCEGASQVIRTKGGVLLATGSYEWNPDYVQSYEHHVGLRSVTPRTVEGDHVVMAADVGAVMVSSRPVPSTPILFGFDIPGGNADGTVKYEPFIPGWPHSILVNDAGERFADDSFLPSIAAGMSRYYGVERGYGNSPAWLLFDQRYRDQYPVGPFYPGVDLPDGIAVQRDSLNELADAVGIDTGNLKHTVERFNHFCESGIDEDFGRGGRKYSRMMNGDRRMDTNPNLGKLETAPFYAIPFVRIGTGIPTAGLEIDQNARIVNARGEVVPGLYAAGNATAHLDVGSGYTSGIANARGLIYGHLAALDAMAERSQKGR